MPKKEIEVIDLTDPPSKGASDDDFHDVRSEDILPNEKTRQILQHSIQTVPERKLRALLSALIVDVPQVEVALTPALLTRTNKGDQLRPKWSTCALCGQDYDVGGSLKCHFHPGELRFNGASSIDEEKRFTWSCCGQSQHRLGCVRGTHSTSPPPKLPRSED